MNDTINRGELLKLLNRKSIESIDSDELSEITGREIDSAELDEIIEGFYIEFMENLHASFAPDTLAIHGLSGFVDVVYNQMLIRYKYRFIARDFEVIMNKNTKMRKHYTSNKIESKQVFLGIFNVWGNMGLMKREELMGMHGDLISRLDLMIEFWPISANVYVRKGGVDKIMTYHRIISREIWPYLTEKGKESLEKALSDFKY